MKQKNNKKGNNVKKAQQSGFTLIELLAVITIMGILMMVAIPAVSRTIENSRRNTFANTAQQYITAIKNNIASDEIVCQSQASGTTYVNASAVGSGYYYYSIETQAGKTNYNQTKDLMEQGGKSPFGSAEVTGYVAIHKESPTTGNTTYKYGIFLVDSAKNGINQLTDEANVGRAAVVTGGTINGDTKPPFNKKVRFDGKDVQTNWYPCKIA